MINLKIKNVLMNCHSEPSEESRCSLSHPELFEGYFNKLFLKLFLCFILLNCNTLELFSQFSASDTSGFIGNYLPIQIKYSSILEKDKDYTFESDLFISNPTVFYPLEILGGNSITINESVITKNTDSTFHLKVKFVNNSDFISNETAFHIKGELLAGNDSITSLGFTNVILNDSLQNEFSSIIRSTSAAGFINYVRFARITDFYPNPIQSGGTLHLDYYIDKNSVITIWLYDLKGNGILIGDLGIVGIGVQSFEYYIEKSMSAGMYWIVLNTFTGTAFKPLVIIK